MTKKETLKYLNPENGYKELLALMARKDRIQVIKEIMDVAYNAVLETLTYEDDNK